MQQLTFIEFAVICCDACGEPLRDLIDLRQPCSKTGVIHQVSTVDHNALYRKTFKVMV